MDAQMKTVMAVTDALFNPMQIRKPTQDELLQAALVSASRLERELNEIAHWQHPHHANIEEALDMVHGIKLNVSGYRQELNAPYDPHEPKCQCDACVAARSDEHYDRYKDGILVKNHENL